VRLPLGLSLRGEAVYARDLAAPAFAGDTLQSTFDLAWAARWERRWVMLEVGGGRRDRFAPAGDPAGLRAVSGFGPSPRTDYVRAAASLRPASWLTLSGWVFDPINGGDFDPPYHARASLTFFSRFWRVFRSGVFALRGEVAVESWGSWLGGVSGNARLGLAGATFVDTNIEMQIGDVTAFWTQRNVNGMRAGYAPGADYPRRLYAFGVQWEFRN